MSEKIAPPEENIRKAVRALLFAASASAVPAGILIALLPVFFRDFLVMYQFRPTVRPLYPVFYGAIMLGGSAIAALGILALVRTVKGTLSAPYGKIRTYALIWFNAFFGAALLIAALRLYAATAYLAADKLYTIIVLGLIVCALLFAALGTVGSADYIFFSHTLTKGKPMLRASRALYCIPLVLALTGATVAGVIILPPDAEKKPFPDGLYHTTLYAQGYHGYNTFKIPTMITAPDGTILAFAEARTDSQEDWSKTDIVVRRSTDLGSSWSELELLFEDGENTLGNACPVVDRATGLIWLIFCKNNDTVFKTHSKDNGKTWAEPTEITADVKADDWSWYAAGPSHGIQLRDGTLMIPADHIAGRKMTAHVIFSRDGGASWQRGGDVPGGEEATLAELPDGSLYINVRPVNPGYRVVARSQDKGLTWRELSLDYALPDPAVQGNLLRIPESADTALYLFTNPADKLHRENMTIRASTDGCRTWSASTQLYAGLASYSALTVIQGLGKNGVINVPQEELLIGCLFECGANYYAEEIVFTRFGLDYLGLSGE
ncbi:MAG: glycoside hydrolase [Oscillospiraceae bacterium]|nr:glycoside hydrolase [Oscillospiraceae bacterium]